MFYDYTFQIADRTHNPGITGIDSKNKNNWYLVDYTPIFYNSEKPENIEYYRFWPQTTILLLIKTSGKPA